MSDDGTRNYYPKGYPEAGTYKIIVDLKHQVTMVFSKDEEGNYTVPVRYMLCSTGKNDCTPKGKFKMDKYHVRFSQFVRDKTYGQFWTQIRGAIYFHSILYSQFDTSTYIEEVWERFGKDREEHRQAAEAGGIIGKGPAGCFWFCNAAGYLQVAAGS